MNVEIHDKVVSYQFEEGPGNVPLIFVHGAGGSATTWKFQRSCFSDLLPVYYLDLPGHGGSEGPAIQSIEQYIPWLRELLNLLQVEEFILAGHSMGSAVTLQTALAMGERCTGLILLGAGARLRVAPKILELIMAQFDKALALIAANLFASSKLDQYFKQVKHDMERCGKDNLASDFKACDVFDVMTKLPEIRTPTLAITGSKDVMTPPKYATYLGEHMPYCEVNIIDGAGHMIMAEAAEESNNLIRQFVKGILD